jgi:hypothetical protein
MEVVKEEDKVIIYFSGHGDVEKRKPLHNPVIFCVGMHLPGFISQVAH